MSKCEYTDVEALSQINTNGGRHGLAATAPPPADEGALSGDARRDSTSFATPAINFHAAKSTFSGGAAPRLCVAPCPDTLGRIESKMKNCKLEIAPAQVIGEGKVDLFL